MPALAALSAGADRLAAEGGATDALRMVAEAACAASGAELAIVRVVEEDGGLTARAVAGPARLAAEIVGSRLPGPPPGEEIAELGGLTADARALAARTGADAVLVVPLPGEERPAGSLELLRAGPPFDEVEREGARLVAHQAGLALRVFAAERVRDDLPSALELAAEALATAGHARTHERVARLVAAGTGASACLLWIVRDGRLELVARSGEVEAEDAREAAEAAHDAHTPSAVEARGRTAVSLPLGRPALGVLQLFLPEPPPEAEMAVLAGLAGGVAQAVRARQSVEELGLDLQRTKSLLSVVGEVTSQLSLAHTLDTAIERVPELLSVDAVGVYLREGGRLETAASRGVAGPHAVVAEHLLGLALGPYRARGRVAFADAAHDSRLGPVAAAVAEAGIEAAHAVPLIAHDGVIGLIAVYPARGRSLTPEQSGLLAALAGQVAVAVQNARLHEETTRLGSERERALDAERVAARRLSALYEISRSFAQSLSLQSTLDAVARTIVDLLEVDAAVIRLPDERGETLVAQAVHVAGEQMRSAVETIFGQPDPIVPSAARRRLAEGRPVRLDAASAGDIGRSHGLLVPFLEGGSTAAVVPIATPSEVLATLTLVSFDPERPVTAETLETAGTVAAQAALAIDNARLYQQQKAFTDSMQRSLLPRRRPRFPGLDIGAVYESSALVGVGGDVYDYLQIGPDRLAIVLGDVTGHGIDAAADMAMAKFVFRSLARLYPEPAAFLAAANDVVVEEIGAGKFITMLYLTVDLRRGEVACASAGHPPPRLLTADGHVTSLRAEGLVLGIEAGHRYEELRRPLGPGASVVLYTDGLVEARHEGELYGDERLDRLLAEQHELSPEQLAGAVLDDCRDWVGGDLRDDCAIVVARRS